MFDDILKVLVGIAIILSAFLTFVLPWLRRVVADLRRRRTLAAPQPIATMPVAGSPWTASPRPTVTRVIARRDDVVTPTTTRGAVTRRVRRPLVGPTDARRGVVLMTILGPCRALEPPPDDGPRA